MVFTIECLDRAGYTLESVPTRGITLDNATLYVQQHAGEVRVSLSRPVGRIILRLSCGRARPSWFGPPRLCTAAIVTTGCDAAAGEPPPPNVTNTAFISDESMPSGLALQRATIASSQAAPNAPKNGTWASSRAWLPENCQPHL
jgi:hypothetical protein